MQKKYRQIAKEVDGVFIGFDLLRDVVSIAGLAHTDKILVITDRMVSGLHLAALEEGFSENQVNYSVYIIEGGEESKSLSVASILIENILADSPTRQSVVVALGGGVVGDLAGFVASVILRGVRLLHIPTTLISQVDSGIGGKTALNTKFGKNLIGTFYPAFATIIDIKVLHTLPQKEFISGVAEVIKHAVIADYNFFIWIEKNIRDILSREFELVQSMIIRSCEIKLMFVKGDEHDNQNQRVFLNFGHTFAHAIESSSGYNISHGEAVAVGIVIESYISYKLGHLSKNVLIRIIKLLRDSQLYLDKKLTFLNEETLEFIKTDKKNIQNYITLILINDIGKPIIKKDLNIQIVQQFLTSMREDILLCC